ncbi:MAG: 3D domain-containing protein [Verrucomicrobiota bacterium]
MKFVHLSFSGIFLLLAGCAQQGPGILGEALRGTPHPGKIYRVKTTAYVGRRNAVGRPLQYGAVTSAAADWSEFPLGTRFRVLENGCDYVIDDYGSAMVGTRIIDLYMPHRRAMQDWGTRTVEIEILEWGSPRRSLEILSPREKAWYVRKMLVSLRRQSSGVPKQFHKVD